MLLQTLMPYLVIVGVAVLFFLVCCRIVLRKPKKMNRKEHISFSHIKKHATVNEKSVENIRKNTDLEKTQVINLKDLRPAISREEKNEQTRMFTKDEFISVHDLHKKQKQESVRFIMESEPEILNQITEPAVLEEYFVRHFLNQYGAVTRNVAQDARTVTHHLITDLPVDSAQETCDILSHIMVQEALQNAQRIYVMMPDEIVLGMVSQAFFDVALGTRSETKTILAYDALKAMPRMESSHFRALALLLLFHYSRNTGNTNAEALLDYTEKYITPFVSAALPDEYNGYQQLEYLYCISLENKEMAFGEILRESYPLIFAFKGCMKNELLSLYADWKPEDMVESLYNSYYKLTVVDDSTLTRLLDTYNIEDTTIRAKILALMHSRGVAYNRQEMHQLLAHIHTDLAKVQDIWDSSMLRKSSLTLMGMYIAKIYIRESIGEDFDLSHWI